MKRPRAQGRKYENQHKLTKVHREGKSTGILRKRFDVVAILSVFLLLGLLQSVAFCDALDGFAGLEGTISIAGGTAHIPVMNDAAKEIMTFNPKIRITVEGGGSGG